MIRKRAGALWRAGVACSLALGFAVNAAAAPDTCSDDACTLGAECERWGDWIVESEQPSASCASTSATATAMAWVQPLSSPTCPFGQCSLYGQQLILDADGTLVTLGEVELPSQHGTGQEGGLWLTRHTSSGMPLAIGLWDFSVPPPGVEVERHGALLRDAGGRALFVTSRAVLPFDAQRSLTARTLSRGHRIAPSSSVFSTPQGWGVSAAIGPTGEWVVSSLRTRPARASVARFTASGRLSWRRTWPEGSEVRSVHVAADQSIVALVLEADGSGFAAYNLNARGVLQWRRRLGSQFDGTQLMVDAAGSTFVVRTLQADFSGEVRVVELDAAGRAVVQWLLPDPFFFASPKVTVDEAGRAALALINFGDDLSASVDWLELGGGTCARTKYAWPPASPLAPALESIHADRHGARFFATTTAIGRLSAGGAP